MRERQLSGIARADYGAMLVDVKNVVIGHAAAAIEASFRRLIDKELADADLSAPLVRITSMD
jgi:hypothetical protein